MTTQFIAQHSKLVTTIARRPYCLLPVGDARRRSAGIGVGRIMNATWRGFFWGLSWLSFAGTATLPSYAAEHDASKDTWVVVHAGTLLAVPGEQPVREKTIVIKNGVIESVLDGYLSTAQAGAADADLVSLRDRFVLPGLMEMHIHLTTIVCKGIFNNPKCRNDRYIGKYDDADRAVTAMSNSLITLMAGFTTVRDMGAQGPAIFSVRDAINQGRIPGPRIFASGRAISVTAGQFDPLLDTQSDRTFCDGPDACRKVVREQIRVGADFIKLAATGGGSDHNGGPDDPPEMLDDEIQAAVDAAHSLKRLVSIHAHGTAGINAALRTGADSVEHGTFPDKESIRLYKKTGAIMVPTLAYITSWDEEYLASLSPEQKVRKSQFLDLQPKGVAMAYKAGVVIAVGTDFGGRVPHGSNALELAAYVELAGMTEMDAIVTATVNGAKLLRKEDVLGTLEPGKYADLIATNTSPLEDIRVLTEIPFVMKGGVVYKSEP